MHFKSHDCPECDSCSLTILDVAYNYGYYIHEYRCNNCNLEWWEDEEE